MSLVIPTLPDLVLPNEPPVIDDTPVQGGADIGPGDVFRFYNTANGTHFYTSSTAERENVLENLKQYEFEGNSFDVSSTGNGNLEVFRFYNADTGAHFYTASTVERDNVIVNNDQFSYEGPVYRAYANDGGGVHEALYRFFNVDTGTHFYTVSETERDNVIETLPQYRYEGLAYYVDVA